jgi:hypothetical protein
MASPDALLEPDSVLTFGQTFEMDHEGTVGSFSLGRDQITIDGRVSRAVSPTS